MEKLSSLIHKMISPSTMSSSKLETPSSKVFFSLIITLITLQGTMSFKKHTIAKSTLVQKLVKKKESKFSMITKELNSVTLNSNASTHQGIPNKAVVFWPTINLESKILFSLEILFSWMKLVDQILPLNRILLLKTWLNYFLNLFKKSRKLMTMLEFIQDMVQAQLVENRSEVVIFVKLVLRKRTIMDWRLMTRRHSSNRFWMKCHLHLHISLTMRD